MNFLLRTAYPVTPEQSAGNESKGSEIVSDERATLQGLIGGDSYSKSSSEGVDRENDDSGVARGSAGDSSAKSQACVWSHYDVNEEEGWIVIPSKKLPAEWNCASDIQALRNLDRSFLFPGEQIHILACLATSKQDAEVITPFKVAAAISRNCNIKQSINGKKEGDTSNITMANADGEDPSMSDERLENGNRQPSKGNGSLEDISATESLIRQENQKKKTQMLLESLKKSHFFVRISDSDVSLWSKKGNATKSDSESRNTSFADNSPNTIIDRGNFDGISSGGIARNSVTCFSLPNGDIVVLLQINVGMDSMKDPVLEILQFEHFPSNNASSKSNCTDEICEDPCGELLTWLLPLDRSLPPRPSPVLNPIPSIGVAPSHRPTLSSSGSQIFSFSNFRTYSMPSFPQTNIPPSVAPPSTTKSDFDLEDFSDVALLDKPMKSHFVGTESLSSFRGVPLEPERFSVQCGLGGTYLPGRRWRRKVEIIQPIEIHTFSANCNTEDLLCVQIKNVSPKNTPEILIFLDSIDIVFEEAQKNGPLRLPMTCIEAGNDHSLPNLALRRGEEHSFVLKPAVVSSDDLKTGSGKRFQSHVGPSGLSIISTKAGDESDSLNSQYSVLVSCRCNYTESKLFFKKKTSWKPRVRKDLMISVASEISGHSFGPEGNKSQLPIQTLTLEASNLTAEDMTLTILAPASLTAPPSVVSLNSVPSSPASPFASFPEFADRGSNMHRLSSLPALESKKENGNGGARSISLLDRKTPAPEVLPNSEIGCTHLWLQSTVPLGFIPAQSSTTVKLELLPLTDGVITLDTLQIAAKEKGLTYVPEHSLKIHATSSIATGIE